MRRNDRVDGVDLLALAWELRLESDDRPVDCQIQPGKQTSKYNIGIGIGYKNNFEEEYSDFIFFFKIVGLHPKFVGDFCAYK